MHVLWKGFISFGLVYIPIKMYSASQEKELKFVMLHKKDLSEIRYARMCKIEEKEIPWEEIVKGYESTPGEYVVLNDDDFNKINLKKSKSIEILNFVKEQEIDTIYYNKSYFLQPEKNAGKAYNLLLDALRKSKKVGITKFVLHNREHLALIKPYENLIILHQLHYANELKAAQEIEIAEKEKNSPQELAIALKLIDHLTSTFDPNQYADTYVEEIKSIIDKKAKGKKIQPKGHELKPSKIHDIMSLLKASLEKDAPKNIRKQKKVS